MALLTRLSCTAATDPDNSPAELSEGKVLICGTASIVHKAGDTRSLRARLASQLQAKPGAEVLIRVGSYVFPGQGTESITE